MKLFRFTKYKAKRTVIEQDTFNETADCNLEIIKTDDRFPLKNVKTSDDDATKNYIRRKELLSEKSSSVLEKNLLKEEKFSTLTYEYEVQDVKEAKLSSLSAKYIMLGTISCHRDFFNSTIYPALLMARSYLYNFKYSKDGVSAYSILKTRIARMVAAAGKRTYLFNDYDEKSVLCAICFVCIAYSLGELYQSYTIKAHNGQIYSPYTSNLENFIKKTKSKTLYVFQKNYLLLPDQIYMAGLLMGGKVLSKLLMSIKDERLKEALLTFKRKQVLHSVLCTVLSDKDDEPYFLERVRPYFKDDSGTEFIAPINWYETPKFRKADADFHEESLKKLCIKEYRNIESYPSSYYDRKLLDGFKALYILNEKLNEQKIKAQKDYTELLRAQEQIRASFVKLQSQDKTQILQGGTTGSLSSTVNEAAQNTNETCSNMQSTQSNGNNTSSANSGNIKARTPVKDYYSSYELLSIIDDYLKQENKQSVEEMFHPRSRVRAFLNKGSCTDFNRRLASVIRQRLNSILSFVREGNLSCDFNLKDAIYASDSDSDYVKVLGLTLYSLLKDSVKNKWAISMIEKFIKEKTKEIEQLQD